MAKAFTGFGVCGDHERRVHAGRGKGFLICNLFLLVALGWMIPAAESGPLMSSTIAICPTGIHRPPGVACVVGMRKRTTLFDTGEDTETLLSKMATFGIDPHRTEIGVLSHIHGDHTGVSSASLN